VTCTLRSVVYSNRRHHLAACVGSILRLLEELLCDIGVEHELRRSLLLKLESSTLFLAYYEGRLVLLCTLLRVVCCLLLLYCLPVAFEAAHRFAIGHTPLRGRRRLLLHLLLYVCTPRGDHRARCILREGLCAPTTNVTRVNSVLVASLTATSGWFYLLLLLRDNHTAVEGE
jgi:hypothetical protein